MAPETEHLTTPHATYVQRAPDWRTCRDLFAGARAMREAGTRYVPRLKGQTDDEYRAYLQRGRFFNGFGRTVLALTGTALQKPPVINAPDAAKARMADVTLAGEPFESVAAWLTQDVLTVGRAGVLVDYSSSANRSYWVLYAAEDIVNWDTEARDGDTVLTFLVLREQVWERQGFEVKLETRYRVCELVPRGAQRVYRSTIYRQVQREGKKEWVADDPVIPMRRGAPLSFIPFAFVGPLGTTPDIKKPPMLDLAEVNLSHWRSSVDLKHGEHWTAVPTPVVTGASGVDTIVLGGKALVLSDPQAKAFFLEYSGQGLEAIRRSLADDERLMAILGSRMLEHQKAGTEAADTVRMRQAGDTATLHSIVGAVSLGLTQVVRWSCFWDGLTDNPIDDTIAARLNDEFQVQELPLDMLSLLAQADKISYATLYYNLERAGLTRPNVTAEQEREQILIEGGTDPMAKDRAEDGRLDGRDTDEDEDGTPLGAQ